MARDLTTGEETHQRHIAQRPAHDLQFGTGSAEMRATAPGTAHVDRASDAARRMRRRLDLGRRQRRSRFYRQFFGLQFFADLGAGTDQIGLGGLGIALAKSQLHTHFQMV